MPETILEPGSNCWGRFPASRLALLVDAESYFAAVGRALARARASVLIASWDLDPRVRLLRDGSALRDREGRVLPVELGPLLNAVASRHKVAVRALVWDMGTVFAISRQIVPIFHVGWSTHPRVRVQLDSDVPVGASHHAKLVVIDDRIAFCGGIDLTSDRWDTRAHQHDDPRRTRPDGTPHAAWHDVQVAVDGAAAAALGDLFRERWRRATGRRLRAPRVGSDPWPEELLVDVEEVRVGVARTEPAWRGRPELREVERLWLDAIRLARHSVYVENQFLTSLRVAEAIERRLVEPGGPEILVVGPDQPAGWLEEGTMGVLRDRIVGRLRAADGEHRFRLLHPVVDGSSALRFHAKVLVVDDRLLRVGSANLNNRSMGTDTEIDLAIEGTSPRLRAAIRRLRDDLLAEHLGLPVERLAEEIDRRGTLLGAVDALIGRDPRRDLAPTATEVPRWLQELVPGTEVLDPERPPPPEVLLESLLSDRVKRSLREPVLLLAAGLVTVAAAWLLMPVVPHSFSAADLPAWARPGEPGLSGPPLAALLMAGAVVLGLPLPVSVPAVAYLFGLGIGLSVALVGAVAGSLLSFAAGRLLGRRRLLRLGGRRLHAVSRTLSRPGALPVIVTRLVPRAPTNMTSLLAGATGVGWRDFTLGTVLGMLPALAVLALTGSLFRRAIVAGAVADLVLSLLVVALAAVLGAGMRRWVAYLDPPLPGQPGPPPPRLPARLAIYLRPRRRAPRRRR